MGLATRVANEEEALAAVEAARREFHDARHHCWAFRLTPADRRERFADDGEPSGSAGKPILAQVAGAQLWNTSVVVVRWFGGTKLGVGGLVRAYGDCAREVLERATRETILVTKRVVFTHPYDCSSAIEQVLAKHGRRPVASDYGAEVRLEFDVRADQADAFAAELVDRSRARGHARVSDASSTPRVEP